MSARFTMEEAAAIERAADARGLTVSAFLRTVAQEAADVAPSPVNTSRIADRLIALADELRPGSKSTRRGYAVTTGRQMTQAAASSSKVLRDGRTSKTSKTETRNADAEPRTIRKRKGA